MMNVHISKHPLILHKLTILRDKTTNYRIFRDLVHELALLLTYEVTQDLNLTARIVETPLGQASGFVANDKIGLIPILRAGLGLVEGVLKLLPDAQVWHIGLYRDEHTLRPVQYYNKLPTQATVELCIILDPMLATGGSAVATVDILKEWGVRNIKFMGLLAAPEGIQRLNQAHPDVQIYVGAVDEGLNKIGFIVPGLGDAGDRQFGTG